MSDRTKAVSNCRDEELGSRDLSPGELSAQGDSPLGVGAWVSHRSDSVGQQGDEASSRDLGIREDRQQRSPAVFDRDLDRAEGQMGVHLDEPGHQETPPGIDRPGSVGCHRAARGEGDDSPSLHPDVGVGAQGA